MTQHAANWEMIDVALRGTWPNGPDPYAKAQQSAYRFALRPHFTDQQVASAVAALALTHGPFRPTPADIAAECRNQLGIGPDFECASWTQVLKVCGNEAWDDSVAVGAEIVRRKIGPTAEAWFLTGGRDLMRNLPLGEHPDAEWNKKTVRESYEAFVEGERRHARRGLTMTVAVNGVIQPGGLRRATELSAGEPS